MMKRISAYQASDGQLFSDKKKCADYQKELNVIEGLKTIGNRIGYDPDLYSEDLGSSAIFNEEQFARFVMVNADDIKLALAGKSLTAKEEVSQS